MWISKKELEQMKNNIKELQESINLADMNIRCNARAISQLSSQISELKEKNAEANAYLKERGVIFFQLNDIIEHLSMLSKKINSTEKTDEKETK